MVNDISYKKWYESPLEVIKMYNKGIIYPQPKNIKMLYKKYVIEVITEILMLKESSLSTINSYSENVTIQLHPISLPINVIKFLNNNGEISEIPYEYDTYDQAMNILNTHYYNIIMISSTISIRISNHYNDTIPPIGVLRSLKLDKIINKTR